MIVIGITGGMASGKSTLAKMLRGPGVIHIDADALVHRLMRHDKVTIAALAEAFPASVTRHKVDRAALAKAIGTDSAALATLEQILHPRVRALEEAAIDRARYNRARAVILDIPLLFETDAHLLCDFVLVAHAPLALRRRRAFRRPGMNEQKWQRLIARQLPDAHRNVHADLVIPTAIGKAATRRVVQRLKKQWGLK